MTNVNKSSPRDDLEITNPKHPFWFATTGSMIKLLLDKPPDSDLKGMIITVYTISEPYMYKLDIVMSDNSIINTIYLKKKEALRAIQDEWMIYYRGRTKVEYIEHQLIDMGKFPLNLSGNLTGNLSGNMSGDLPNIKGNNGIVDSCPPSPSPREIRRGNFRSMLKEIAETHRKRSLRNDNLGENISLSSSNSETGSNVSNSGSSEVSPRSETSSPRKNWLNRRFSLQLKRTSTSGDSSPKSPRPLSPGASTDTKLSSSDEDLPSANSPNIRSPRTTRLLRSASLKLALRMSGKHSDIDKTVTPRNSESVIVV